MGNLINLPNITFDSLVVEGQNKPSEKKTNTFDAKNYLNTRLSDGEKDNYGRTDRSLHFMKDIPSGSKIGFDDVKVLRTEKILSPGISPEFYETVIGKILVKDAKDGEGVTFSHFFKE